MIAPALIRRGLALSVVLHAAIGAVGYLALDPSDEPRTELVDIELAPTPPPVEALPAERAMPPEQDLAAQQTAAQDEPSDTTSEPGDLPSDAGVDAPIDAVIDAAIDAAIDAPRRGRDAAPEDAGVDAPLDAVDAAIDDAGPTDDAITVAEIDPWDQPAAGSDGSGAGSGPGGSGSGSGALATEEGSGSGTPGTTDEVALDGAPTTAGTAANLLAYFPNGHIVTALIRFDRLRGTEWLAQTEQLLRPMPDYQVLFGASDAKIGDKLDTLIISTPRPLDATATTLVAHTRLTRPALREFLGATTRITWSTARGGMLGRRTSKVFPGDRRLFLSPFRSWFLLVQPSDITTLASAAPGNLDQIEATGKLPPWLAGIRKIEAESGDPRGPALVLTLGTDGKRLDLGTYSVMIGVKSFPTPERVSLAMELVKQGWLVRGNLKFANAAAAAELVTAATTIKDRIAASRVLQLALGKPAARVIANVSFVRTGPRVSYTTSISISDARAIMAVAAQYLAGYYAGATP